MTQPPNQAFDPFSIVVNWLTARPYATIAIVGLLVTLPLILFGLPAGSHDAVSHVFYSENFSHQLALGEFYPRWLYLTNGGLGSPTFFSYQPLPSYIAHVFRLLPVDVLHQLGAASSLAIIFSGLAAVLWLKEIAAPRPALLGAVVFMLMPYPVGHDLYVRAAFGEVFTFVWMPLILFFAVRISRGGRLAIVGLAVCYALLCLTHLPITVIFSGIPVLYVFFLAERKIRFQAVARTIGGMILGVGMAAIYIIPVGAYQDYAYLHELREGHFHYSFWLMTTEWAVRGNWSYFSMPVSVGLAGLFSFLAGILLLAKDRRRELLFWFAVLISSFLLMLEISAPVWAALTYLQAIQFPFRFNAILSIAAMPLIALAFSSVKRPLKWHSVLIIVAFACFGINWLSDFRKVTTEAFVPPADWIQEAHARVRRLQIETHGRWSRTVPFREEDLEKNLAKIPLIGDERAKAFVTTGTGNVSVLKWKPRDIEINVETPTEITVSVAQSYFPGWRARIDGREDDLPISPTPDLGLISITVPPGNRYVKVTLEELWPEYISEWTSAIFVVLTLGLLMWLVYRPITRPALDESRI